jgi:hypothetical protein
MRRRLGPVALALCAALLLPACTLQVHGEPRAQGSSATTLIRVVNTSSQSISYLYVSPGDDMSWGEDLLDVDVLGPGEQCDITLSPGVWDVKCVASDGQELVFWDQDVSSGTQLTISDQ